MCALESRTNCVLFAKNLYSHTSLARLTFVSLYYFVVAAYCTALFDWLIDWYWLATHNTWLQLIGGGGGRPATANPFPVTSHDFGDPGECQRDTITLPRATTTMELETAYADDSSRVLVNEIIAFSFLLALWLTINCYFFIMGDEVDRTF